jgi:hypothetical protein
MKSTKEIPSFIERYDRHMWGRVTGDPPNGINDFNLKSILQV